MEIIMSILNMVNKIENLKDSGFIQRCVDDFLLKKEQVELLIKENSTYKTKYRTCINCESVFSGKGKGKYFCSDKCKPNSFLLEGRDRFRERVRERDNYTCQDCGLRRTREESKKLNKKSLDVHHLNGLCGKKSKGYDNEKDMDFLVTLCHKCHFNRPEHTVKKG